MAEPDTRLRTRELRFGDRRYPVLGPDIRDPRLHVAAVVVSLQVLGQTVLHFDVSIAQILVAIATCAAIETTITLWRQQTIAWPASALLTGNGVAFVLRVPGTRHGDWWSLRGGWIFAAVAAVSLLSKYVIRVDGRPLFNPSNIGLVLCFLVLGSRRVDPLDFWWVRPGVALAVAVTIIVAGGIVLAWRVRMLGLVASFWLTYAAALGVLALRGHCITARWHIGPVCNGYFWTVLVTSPEVLVFMFFMITDPKTVPHGRTARNVYGAAIALVFVALAAPQRTEFATKVALLGALLIVCAARPLLERWSAARIARLAQVSDARRGGRRAPRIAIAVAAALVYSLAVVGAGTGARTAKVSLVAVRLPAGCGGRTETPSPRPRVTSGALPPIVVHDAIDVATPITARVARKIVGDVLADLAIEARAVERRDPRLALAVARFPWVDALVSKICNPTATRVVSNYRVAAAKVAVAKRSVGQAFPEIDVQLRGEVRETTLSGSSPPKILSERTVPFRRTFVVSEAGSTWLVCGDRSDARTSACITKT
jgi:Na+-translocating ferredoxin:NAD+ oxidoreductase RnfD subunit